MDNEHFAVCVCDACYQTACSAERVASSTATVPVDPRPAKASQKSERRRIQNRRIREAQYGISCKIPLGYEDLVLEIFGHRCAACGRTGGIGELFLDHHRPLSDGHPLLHNAVPLCSSCNSKKNNKAPEQFYDALKLAQIEVLLREIRDTFEVRLAIGGVA